MRGETPGDLPQLFIPAKEARKHKNIPLLQKRIGKKLGKIVIRTKMCMTKTNG